MQEEGVRCGQMCMTEEKDGEKVFLTLSSEYIAGY